MTRRNAIAAVLVVAISAAVTLVLRAPEPTIDPRLDAELTALASMEVDPTARVGPAEITGRVGLAEIPGNQVAIAEIKPFTAEEERRFAPFLLSRAEVERRLAERRRANAPWWAWWER